MRGKWVLVCAAAVFAGMGAGAFFRFRKPPPAPASPTKAAAPIASSSLTLTGKIRAAHVVVVNSQVDGNIDAFEANVGDEVMAGQELARIGGAGLETEQADAAAAVEKAQARVEAAEKNVATAQLEASRAHANALRARTELDRLQKTYDRQKMLVAAGATPRLTYEKAQHDFEIAQEQWEAVDKASRSAEERVRDTLKELDGAKRILMDRNDQLLSAQSAVESGVVLAPVDGVIVGRSGEVGQPAEELADGLFQIGTDLYDLEVALEAKPEVLRQMKPHQPALVIIPDLQGTSITGEVKEIKDAAAVISFKSAMPAIRPGMVAEVRLQTP
jgi:multidrug efflux pump subunit AcrA (membrane-fusion protein)